MIATRAEDTGPPPTSALSDNQSYAEAQPGELWEMRRGFADPLLTKERSFP